MKMMDFATKIEQVIRERKLLSADDRVLVALSGGADSVALLCVLSDLGYECVAVHCNFHLRGEESMRDERFVRSLCQRRKIEAHFIDFDVDAYMKAHKVSTEMACRELRYEWFEKQRVERHCRFIAVAHHRNDDIETLFLNLMRGSGIAGVSGMKYRNGNIIRPLLSVTRNDIEEYLHSLGQDYVMDSTNLENDFSRNKIRNIILPLIQKCFPNAENGFGRSLDNLKADFEVNRLSLDLAANSVTEDGNGCLLVNIQKVKQFAEPVALLRYLFSAYGFNVSQIEEMLRVNCPGAVFESGKFIVEVGREWMSLFDNSKFEDEQTFKLDSVIPAILEMQVVENQSDFKFGKNPNIAYFDESVLDEELVLRHWREGDRFTPFGMRGSKKVSDFFNDNKFSLYQKRATWLLCGSSGILWIVGHRASSLFRVSKDSKRIVMLKYLS